MFERISGILKRKPALIALGLAVALAISSVSLLALGLQRGRQAEGLSAMVIDLEVTLEQLRQAERQGLQSLEAEVAAARERLASLQSSFPEIGTPFDLYRRAFDLAQPAGVEILGVQRLGGSSQTTVVSGLEVSSYSVFSRGDLAACLAFLSSLEAEGLQTLSLENIAIDPGSEHCDFEVTIARGNLGGGESQAAEGAP
jgi:hypothetical protein